MVVLEGAGREKHGCEIKTLMVAPHIHPVWDGTHNLGKGSNLQPVSGTGQWSHPTRAPFKFLKADT